MEPIITPIPQEKLDALTPEQLTTMLTELEALLAQMTAIEAEHKRKLVGHLLKTMGYAPLTASQKALVAEVMGFEMKE